MSSVVTIFTSVNMLMLLGAESLRHLRRWSLSLVDSFNRFPKYAAVYTSTSRVWACVLLANTWNFLFYFFWTSFRSCVVPWHGILIYTPEMTDYIKLFGYPHLWRACSLFAHFSIQSSFSYWYTGWVLIEF